MADYGTEQNLRLAQQMLKQQGEINALRAERDALKAELEVQRTIVAEFDQVATEKAATVERVRELHAKFVCGCGDDHQIGCKECRDGGYPCPTIRALDGGE